MKEQLISIKQKTEELSLLKLEKVAKKKLVKDITEYTKEELHDKLILFVREVYGEKDEDVLYEKAKKIFLN